ncbi:hypothetical protein V6N13_044326 [Hibiscus sabdariffa]
MVPEEGYWKWNELESFLPNDVLHRLLATPPPTSNDNHERDMIFGAALWVLWKHINLYVFDPTQLDGFSIYEESIWMSKHCAQAAATAFQNISRGAAGVQVQSRWDLSLDEWFSLLTDGARYC